MSCRVCDEDDTAAVADIDGLRNHELTQRRDISQCPGTRLRLHRRHAGLETLDHRFQTGNLRVVWNLTELPHQVPRLLDLQFGLPDRHLVTAGQLKYRILSLVTRGEVRASSACRYSRRAAKTGLKRSIR